MAAIAQKDNIFNITILNAVKINACELKALADIQRRHQIQNVTEKS